MDGARADWRRAVIGVCHLLRPAERVIRVTDNIAVAVGDLGELSMGGVLGFTVGVRHKRHISCLRRHASAQRILLEGVSHVMAGVAVRVMRQRVHCVKTSVGGDSLMRPVQHGRTDLPPAAVVAVDHCVPDRIGHAGDGTLACIRHDMPCAASRVRLAGDIVARAVIGRRAGDRQRMIAGCRRRCQRRAIGVIGVAARHAQRTRHAQQQMPLLLSIR